MWILRLDWRFSVFWEKLDTIAGQRKTTPGLIRPQEFNPTTLCGLPGGE